MVERSCGPSADGGSLPGHARPADTATDPGPQDRIGFPRLRVRPEWLHKHPSPIARGRGSAQLRRRDGFARFV
jgi:hypothetical protein